MSEIDQTTDEILDSLTGHEEMSIAQHFGRTIGELIPEPAMYRRALIFVVKKRDGVNEDDARNAVLGMRLKDALDYFPAVKADDAEPDAEVVGVVEESGKDELPFGPQPAPSLSSVS